MNLTPVVVIGAGPAGLATARELALRAVPYRLIDRGGAAGGAYRSMYEGMTIASPARHNGLPGLALEAAGEYVTVPEYRDYLARYAAEHALVVEQGTVARVARDEEGFVIDLGAEQVRARSVVVASGMWDFPRRPALEGLAVPQLHARDWRGIAARNEPRIVVLGGGTSAIEIAEEIAEARERVWVAARSGVHLLPRRLLGRDTHDWFRPIERVIPRWMTASWCAAPKAHPGSGDSFAALRKAGRIVVCPGIVGASATAVTLEGGAELEVDLVVSATGFRFDAPFIPAEVERAPGGHLRARRGESVSWPGLFVVGAPCARNLDSEFLRGIARDAPAVAAQIAKRSLA